jgi:2-keto-4-pentenoate hydratase/2-oxohepta-3-ene-1,7-dioic acid hydratase in catechol pathway
MKLATFSSEPADAAQPRIGSVADDQIVDLTLACAERLRDQGVERASEEAHRLVPPDMLEFLRGEDASRTAAQAAEAYALDRATARTDEGEQYRFELDSVELLSPLLRPPTLKDFSAFEQHVKNGFESYGLEVPEEWYNLPVCYKGNPDSIVGPNEVVDWPPFTEKLDYELELAAVIGKRGRNVTAEEATDYIAGYTIFNDFSARDIQAREMGVRFGPAKGKDFANGLGPYLVTPDEFDVEDTRMTARINGEVWSDGDTSGMYHRFEDMIEYMSWGQDIYPGEVYGSGTIPYGCGKGLGRWIEPGDEIELEIEGIGVLRHTVGEQTEQVERDYDTDYEFDHR